ncbi:MAG: transporter substrate-binding domain-containing protein [Anaerolineales bacterium]|nr:transporter substrate-binding domain-containing protein [Anaerolineales bacterium]
MDNNYPPYAFMDERGKLQGILVDQWKLWEERTGVKVEIVGLPWEQALGRMKNGEFDAIDTIFYTSERAKIFDYTEPYAAIDVRIFFPSAVSGIADVKSLRGFRVAVKTGDANVEYLIERGINNLVYYNSYEDIVKAAANKKETIFVVDQPPALYFLYKYNIQNQFNYSEPLYGGEFHRAVKKGNAPLLALINNGFENISEAEYKQINDRWFGTNQYAGIIRFMPYLGIGAAVIALLIAALVIFNRTLQTQVSVRTKESEEALANLKISEARFRDALEFLPIPISIADNQGNILGFNRKFTEHYGYTAQDTPTIARWILRAYPEPAYREKVVAQWESDVAFAIREQTSSPQREYKITGKDGREHDTEIVMRAVGDLWVASFVEITEHKRAEAALREAETKYRALVEHAPEVIYLDEADEFSSSLYISAQVKNLLDYTPADFAQNPRLWHDLIYPQDYRRAAASINTTLTLGGSAEEYRMTKRDGSLIWVRDTSVSIYNENKEVSFIQGFLQDITERKKVEEQLKESEERYRTLFEDSPIPLYEEDFSPVKTYIDELRKSGVEDLRAYFAKNPQEIRNCANLARVIDVNKAAVMWSRGKSKAELQGALLERMNPSGYQNLLEEFLTLADGNSHYEFAFSRLDDNGAPQHIIINGTIAPNYEETWERILISIVDVTERKKTEENLAKQLELLRGLRAIDQAIIMNFDLSVNLNILIREIIAQLHVDAVSVSLFKDQTLQFAVGQGFKTDAKRFSRLTANSGLTNRVARERHNIHIRNLQEMDYPSNAARAIEEEGFVAYHGVPLIVKGQLLGALEIFHRSALVGDSNWQNFMEMLAGQAAISIESATLFDKLQTSNAEIQLAYDVTLEGWSRALDLRDKETEGHTRRVTELTLQLARKLDVPAENMIHLKRGALLHDIGKMGIPDSILLKPGPLTDEEREIMRKHPVYAYEMLVPIKYLHPALDIAYRHHERWDGSGYPNGLKGEEIPLAARIFAVVDVWDALTTNRPYRPSWTKERVKEHLRQRAGGHFDPHIVKVFLQMIEEKSAG